MARVLVVDDSIYVRSLVRRVLERAGHDVVGEAGDGVQALERFAELQPELTIMDIVLPKQDGLSVLSTLRKIVPSARVLIYSAYAHDEKRNEALLAGATGYLTKTSDCDVLASSVAETLAA
jgi:two-component system chemotaxis response regulator CheY